ncbi:MAG: DUF4390 domain-containing protein [Candidatus Thioglobus sp.]|jgi:hypothetical protein|nr:DUF4390 domain-containing protein [Candidatus Thioglobus sp.]|tara:strand:+ start:187 stop:738 length:552 start_codon:yes stop_codon:yes gene_type:complete
MSKKLQYSATIVLILLLSGTQGFAKGGGGKSYVRDGVYYSDIQLPFRLEQQQIEALDSGVTLSFQLDFSIVDVRSWRIDRDIGTLSQAYSIRLNAFTGRYSITNLNIGTKFALSSTQEVESFLSEIKNIPLVDDSILDIERNYSVIMQASITAEGISQWIKTLSFWRQNLDTEFETIEWMLLD